jgi:hypothetical protein
METTSEEDEIFLDAADHILLEALTAIGNDPNARFAFFRRLLAVVQEAAAQADGRAPSDTNQQ